MKLMIRERSIGNVPILEVVEREKRNQLRPLIIYYHGWQSSKELVLTQGRKLAEAGFRVLLPDAANHGERKQPIIQVPSLTFWQSIQANLFEFGSLVNHFKKLGLADDRIGVGGVSMGGITTCALMTNHPEIKTAACIMGSPKPVYYRERIYERATESGRYVPEDYKNLLAWIPYYDLSLRPGTLAGRPMLFWHGIEDKIVPYSDAAEFVAENPDANLTFVDEDEKHLVKVAAMEMITAFFVDKMSISN